MKPEVNVYDLFRRESPEVFTAFNGLVQSLVNTKGLDAKTKQLLYIGMKIVAGDDTAVKFHIPMAVQAGATRDEIKETFLLTLVVTGLKGLGNLPAALEMYDAIAKGNSR
ncbi:MAG TPA: carboxymuconolactone decarboxylase family protein [Chitinophagaceae bacterium]|nr:carboxymuconolactone decarboxylase family protein [Chitinophagaceae bacterium]